MEQDAGRMIKQTRADFSIQIKLHGTTPAGPLALEMAGSMFLREDALDRG